LEKEKTLFTDQQTKKTLSNLSHNPQQKPHQIKQTTASNTSSQKSMKTTQRNKKMKTKSNQASRPSYTSISHRFYFLHYWFRCHKISQPRKKKIHTSSHAHVCERKATIILPCCSPTKKQNLIKPTTNLRKLTKSTMFLSIRKMLCFCRKKEETNFLKHERTLFSPQIFVFIFVACG